MEELRAYLKANDFDVPNLTLDGNIQRFPRKGSRDSGWLIGWLKFSRERGKPYAVAVFGDWKTDEQLTYFPGWISRNEQNLCDKEIKEARKKIEVERAALQKEAVIKSQALWNRSNAEGLTPYLERKKIDGLYGARRNGDNVIVPMQLISGEMIGAQSIKPDGEKFFIKGQRVSEAFFVIGDLDGTEAYLCEGFATGCSLHMALMRNVVVTFNASNLVKVARVLRAQFPDMKMTICGDDDRKKVPNIGREKAEQAGLVGMAPVVFPTCEGTDFNDLHCEQGLEAVKRQLELEKDPERGFRALGYDESGYHFFCVETMDVCSITNFAPNNLFRLAPKSFWNGRYKHGDDDKVNWQNVADDLIQMCKKKGPYNPSKIRGLGVWQDQGQTIVNTGSRLLIKSVERPLFYPESDFIYVQSGHKMPKFRGVATIEECRVLLDACAILKWDDPNSQYLLPGWLAIARVAGALPVRPHIWLTGGSATGKSTVLSGIIEPALGGSEVYRPLVGGTTEAGIRQYLKSSSLPIVFDEFESVTNASSGRHEAIVELLRNAWSASSGQVLKGSAGGTASTFSLAFCALLSSINVTLPTDADRSRFSVLELLPHGDDNEQYERLMRMMHKITPELGHRIFARTIQMLPELLASYQVLREEVAVQSRQRMGQQIGMLMAGWWILQSDRTISREEARAIAAELDVRGANRQRLTEEQACFRHLMTQKIRLNNGHSATLEDLIQQLTRISDEGPNAIRDAIECDLKTHGIIVRNNDILIAKEHSVITAFFAHSKWPDWPRQLQRLTGINKLSEKPIRFGNDIEGKKTELQRAIVVPISFLA